MSGVVAAGHPETAEAGAEILRNGGNAVDAAIAAVMASFAAESPLTGFGAGGYMMVHDPHSSAGVGATRLIDFFVAAPGRSGIERARELNPVEVRFDSATTQVFNVGAASCGVPGTPAGLALAAERYGSAALADLSAPAIALARGGARLNAQQAFILKILEPIYTATPTLRAVYAPQGRILGEGEVLRIPELAEALERFGEDGPAPFYEGEVAEALAAAVQSGGGTLSLEDLGAYEAIEREPVTARYRGHEVLTSPPPSSGGVLVALALELLARIEGSSRGAVPIADLVTVMATVNQARDAEFIEALGDPRLAARLLESGRLDQLAGRAIRADRLGSTTHIAAVDGRGMCASVTCSNGTGSGIMVPGTGVHLNNMMGEQDLNPLGFHRAAPGSRMPSMMSPTVVLRHGELVAGLGSAGSNRIRSAILQTVVNLIGDGMDPVSAVGRSRLHFEDGVLQAEPGVDAAALSKLERAGVPVIRWRDQNLFFGGVQMIARTPGTSGWTGAADPRRGGAVAVASA